MEEETQAQEREKMWKNISILLFLIIILLGVTSGYSYIIKNNYGKAFSEGYEVGILDTAILQVQNGIFVYPINETSVGSVTIQELCSGGQSG